MNEKSIIILSFLFLIVLISATTLYPYLVNRRLTQKEAEIILDRYLKSKDVINYEIVSVNESLIPKSWGLEERGWKWRLEPEYEYWNFKLKGIECVQEAFFYSVEKKVFIVNDKMGPHQVMLNIWTYQWQPGSQNCA